MRYVILLTLHDISDLTRGLPNINQGMIQLAGRSGLGDGDAYQRLLPLAACLVGCFSLIHCSLDRNL